ncbi:uncharacterized protein LOC126376683 [Pectinophora gossypiella]|uniref:uncharacterized protein LOC126376683 n=1 Tax=Pectinophora gossypiella TaxID=13191 RepID=UPI00214E0110|nr:uncharacterized protein LOC126376683 [Pectinophora gossypiella]XP_049880192.1 uncharacterized protein LOC126376683 [Pectinophora gossypiella]
MFGNMLNARLAGIEDRLLPEPRQRPPLAADGKVARADPAHKETAGALVAFTGSSAAPVTRPNTAQLVRKVAKEAISNSQALINPPAGRKGKKRESSLAAKEAAEMRNQPAPAPEEVPWTVVVGRKAKIKASQAKELQKSRPAVPAQQAPKKAKLRVPSTAVVTLTLVVLGVEERGVTYASILSDAKQRVRLADLGISSMRFRRAATGARLLEIGGEDSAAKADSLAKKLREVLSPDAVKVVRPVKCAEIRVTGLDDSVDAARLYLSSSV